MKLASMLMFYNKSIFIVDYTKNVMKRFTENDDVLNAVSALVSNSPFFLSTEMLINLVENTRYHFNLIWCVSNL